MSAVLFAAIAALAVAACDDGPSGPETHNDHPVTSLVVAPLTLDLEVGDEVTLSATARCVHDVVITPRITWSSDKTSVATVGTDGKVTAAAFGSTTIRASAGSESATVGVAVAPEGTVVSIAGGLVGSADGVITLEFPAGALLEPTDIVIQELPDETYSDDPLYVAGTAYRIRPDGLQLQDQARIRIRYEDGNLPWGSTADRLRIHERDRDRDRWLEMDQNQVRLQEHQVEAVTARLGYFALVPAHFAMLGNTGGDVTSADGLGTLMVHEASLGEDVEINIHRLPDDSPLFSAGPLYIPGTAFELVPDGLAFQERAHFRIQYDPANLPPGVSPEQLRVQYFDRNQNRWRETVQNQVRVDEREVEAEIEHFSVYALVAANGGTVGVEGGLIASADGLVSLEIPSGALDEDVEITIDPVPSPSFAGDPFYIGGTAYELKPNGLQFQEMARLQIRYDAGELPDGMLHERLRIRERDQAQNQWRETEMNQVHVEDRIAEGMIEHFSVYAVVGLDQAEIPVASVSVDPAVLTLEVDNTAMLDAVALGEDGYPVTRTFTWSSDDPEIVSVEDGVITALMAGTVDITATAEGRSGSATVTVPVWVTSVTVTPANPVLAIGDTRQLTAIARGVDGSQILRDFVWSSSNEAVATVSTSGLVTAIGDGTATIAATTAGVTGNAFVTVHPPVARVVIDDIGMEPLEIGLTKQLDATAYDASNIPVDAIITWTSSDEGLATVDETGLVTAVGRGVVTITASVGAVSASVDIRTVGEAGGYGNNLSWPVVFADGIGITGDAVSTDPGVRPAPAEGITVDVLPFFWSENVPNYDIYYEQQSFNVWQAEWIDGTGQPEYDATINWGDNLTHMTWSASRPIRVEQVLSANGLALDGYVMTYLYGQGPSEMQGTDGTVATFTPTIYTIGASVTIEKLDGEGGSPVATVNEVVVGSEVNVGGKIIYGYNLFLSDWTPPAGVDKAGWYRITYRLDDGANVSISAVGNTGDELIYIPEVHPSGRYSWIDIYIEP